MMGQRRGPRIRATIDPRIHRDPPVPIDRHRPVEWTSQVKLPCRGMALDPLGHAGLEHLLIGPSVCAMTAAFGRRPIGKLDSVEQAAISQRLDDFETVPGKPLIG